MINEDTVANIQLTESCENTIVAVGDDAWKLKLAPELMNDGRTVERIGSRA
jgi:hypothetical protein